MIEFSQAELSILRQLVRAKITQNTSYEREKPDVLASILSKLQAARVKPTLTAELFGLDDRELHALEIRASQGDQMAKLQLEFGPDWNSSPA